MSLAHLAKQELASGCRGGSCFQFPTILNSMCVSVRCAPEVFRLVFPQSKGYVLLENPQNLHSALVILAECYRPVSYNKKLFTRSAITLGQNAAEPGCRPTSVFLECILGFNYYARYTISGCSRMDWMGLLLLAFGC